MTMPSLDQIAERVETLPRLPDTTFRLLQVANDPKSSVGQMVEVIRYDQTITAELLRLCNSAHFGLSRPIVSLDDAICYVGTAKLLQLVLAAHTRAMLNRAQEGYGLPPGALWTNSVGVALGAHLFALRFGLEDSGLAFTAGLLHDVGKIVLNEYVAAEYAQIARRVAEEKISFLEAERAVLGFTHAEIGERVAQRWDLPAAIVRCIRYHHEPERLAPPDPLVDVVHLADAICLLMGVGVGDDGLLYRAHPDVLARHQLTARDLEGIGAEVVLELKTVRKMFAAGEEPQHAR